MICQRCIFLSDCNGILLYEGRCNFFLEHSDIDLSMEKLTDEAKDMQLDMQTDRIWSKN